MKRLTTLILLTIMLALAACNTSTPTQEAQSATATPLPAGPTATPIPADPTAIPAKTAAATTEPAQEQAETAEPAGAKSEEAGPEFNPDAPPLTLVFIPQENPEKLVGDLSVISDYLEGELGFPVQGFVANDHAAAVEALRNGEADVAFMGALPYVMAHELIGAEIILGEVYRGSSYYTGRIFVRKDSGITQLEDLRGKTIAFADPISESGYIYPLDLFVEAGFLERGEDPQNFFEAVYFAGGYQQAMQAVVSGYADAAGASQFADLLLTPEQLEQITWIAETDPIPSHGVMVRQDLDPARVDAFKQAMLKLNQPEYQHLLQYVLSPDGYVEVAHEDYASVEAVARDYGFLE